MTRDEAKNNVNGFLIEYRVICEKYGLTISGCGCCDSPFILEPRKENMESIENNVAHLSEERNWVICYE